MNKSTQLVEALLGTYNGPFHLHTPSGQLEACSKGGIDAIKLVPGHDCDVGLSPIVGGKVHFFFAKYTETMPDEVTEVLAPTAVLYRNFTVIHCWALEEPADAHDPEILEACKVLSESEGNGLLPLPDFAGWELVACNPENRHSLDRMMAFALGRGTSFHGARVMTPFRLEAYSQPITITVGPNQFSEDWKPKEMPLAEFLAEICQHRIGKKDGKAFVLGDAVPGRRLKTSVKSLTGIGLDIDVGTPSDKVDQALAQLGRLAVRYTTHSHWKTKTLIKRDRFLAFANGREIDATLVRDFARTELQWEEELAASAEFGGVEHVTEGIMVAIQHVPFPKHRVVIPLAAPFVIADEAPTQADAIKMWAKVPLALGKLLGLRIDEACADTSRLFYYPRHDKARPYEVSVFGGPCFDWHTLELDDPLELLVQEVDKGKKKSVTPEGQDLGRWCHTCGEGFRIADVIEDQCPQFIRGSAGVGFNIECPFDENHTNAGDRDDRACFVRNAGDGIGEIFTISCRHQSCRNKTMLDMLGKMLKDEWFGKEVLTDQQYNSIELDGKSFEAMSKKYVFDDRDELVEAINRDFCIVKIGSNTRYIDETDDELKFLTKQAMSDWIAPYKLKVEDKEGNPKLTSGFSAWMSSPKRRWYSSVVFNPHPEVPAHHYNLWKGFAIEPVKGDWSLMKAHLYDIICDREYDNFIWLVSWLAQLFQEPWNKCGTAVVLRSPGKGTGKSTLGDCLAEMLGKHAVTLAQGKHLTGQFNAHFEKALLVIAEESYWAGDKGGEGVLKHFITGRTHRIERKGVDSFEVENFSRLMLLTNSDWAVPSSTDERRYFVLDVSEAQKRNRDYFDPLYREIATGAPAAMLYDLLRFDFRQVDLRNPPRTMGLVGQIVETFERDMRWWYDALIDGAFTDRDGAEVEWPLDTSLIIGRDVLFRSYSAQVKGTYGKPATSARLGSFLKAMLKGEDLQAPRSSEGLRQRQYKLPSLKKAREIFTALKNVTSGGDNASESRPQGRMDEVVRLLIRDVALSMFDRDDEDDTWED